MTSRRSSSEEAAPQQAILGALSRLGEEPLPGELPDDVVVSGALAGFAEGMPGLGDEPTPSKARGPRWGVVIGIGFAAGAIAAAIMLFVVQPDMLSGLTDVDAPSLSPSVSTPGSDSAGEAFDGKRERQRSTPKPESELQTAVTPTPPLAPEATLEGAPRPKKPSSGSATRRRGGPSTAEGWLTEAQARLKAGEAAAALRAYAELQRHHPGSTEANAALVSMGRIELNRGRAKRALSHFDAYLGRSAGTVRQEARYGRIRSLRKLGRERQELASIKAFLADHPGSIYASRLKARARELQASP